MWLFFQIFLSTLVVACFLDQFNKSLAKWRKDKLFGVGVTSIIFLLITFFVK